jgi:hypothetical protein
MGTTASKDIAHQQFVGKVGLQTCCRTWISCTRTGGITATALQQALPETWNMYWDVQTNSVTFQSAHTECWLRATPDGTVNSLGKWNRNDGIFWTITWHATGGVTLTSVYGKHLSVASSAPDMKPDAGPQCVIVDATSPGISAWELFTLTGATIVATL